MGVRGASKRRREDWRLWCEEALSSGASKAHGYSKVKPSYQEEVLEVMDQCRHPWNLFYCSRGGFGSRPGAPDRTRALTLKALLWFDLGVRGDSFAGYRP
eukprot:974487-Pyramimonas_sp.AAC.1